MEAHIYYILLILSALVTVSSTINLSHGKPTRQSSTLGTSVSSYAVDGLYYIDQGTCNYDYAHSNKSDDQTQWWVVDLGDTYSISSIEVYGRTDCCLERFNNFSVDVISEKCQCDKWTAFDRGRTVMCHYQSQPDSKLDITCPAETTGRYVRIRKDDTKYLTICEVIVNGDNIIDNKEKIVARPACGFSGMGYSGNVLFIFSSISKIQCVALCDRDKRCCVAEFRTTSKSCVLKTKANDEDAESLLFGDEQAITYLMG